MITPVKLLDGTAVNLVDANQFFDLNPDMEVRPLVEFKFIFAVFRAEACIGWTTKMVIEKAGMPLPD